MPPGLYVMTREGSNNAVKAFFDRDYNYQKWQITDVALGEMALKLGDMTTERDKQVHLNLKKDEVILGLKKELRSDKFWKYASGGAVLFLSILLVTQK